MKNIRVLIVDDHSVVRMGLAALLKYQKGITVVGEAQDGAEAAEKAAALKPDVVVMDLMMPGTDGIEGTRRVRTAAPEAKVLILTTFGTSNEVAHALEAGAIGAIMKGADNDELVAAIRSAAVGDGTISAEIKQSLAVKASIPKLTGRQLEILDWVTRGFSNPDIAKHLGISSDAVKQHLNVVFQKLGASSRAEAVAIALREQLLKI